MSDNNVTVPVIIDSVKNIESFQMTRCSYFCIENSAPSPGWSLSTSGSVIPFIMIGLSGVITRPPDGEQLFSTPKSLDRLFEVIEMNQTIYVDQKLIGHPS